MPTTYNNTHVQSGETLNIKSGNDTNLIGAVAQGNTVNMQVGNDLTMQSLQDTATSKAKQSNTGISLSVPIGTGTGSASLSQSNQNSNSSYASVYEQTAIRAGADGFNINVKHNTDLKGAVIDSQANLGKNNLTTGTLSVSDIQNHMDAKASSSGISLNSDMLDSKYAAVKGLASNALNNGKAETSDDSTTLSAIAPASIVISNQAEQEQTTGKTAQETIATLNRDTTNTNRVLEKPDVAALQQQAQQIQQDRVLLLTTATAFTDESFRKMFVEETKMYKMVRDQEGKAQWVELGSEEKANLKPGLDGKVHIFNNGIFNPLENAQSLATQNNNADYLVYFPNANNFFSELLVSGYQKFLEGSNTGLTNATQTNVEIMNQYGQSGLQVDGHSRGGLTAGNAMEVVASQGNAADSLSNTNISLFGSAYNAQQAADLLNFLSDGSGTLQSQVHIDDFVGTVIGGNNPTGGTTPINSNLLKEWVKIFYGASTAHNGYGEGRNDGESTPYWQDSSNGKPSSVLIKPTP